MEGSKNLVESAFKKSFELLEEMEGEFLKPKFSSTNIGMLFDNLFGTQRSAEMKKEGAGNLIDSLFYIRCMLILGSVYCERTEDKKNRKSASCQKGQCRFSSCSYLERRSIKRNCKYLISFQKKITHQLFLL